MLVAKPEKKKTVVVVERRLRARRDGKDGRMTMIAQVGAAAAFPAVSRHTLIGGPLMYCTEARHRRSLSWCVVLGFCGAARP